MNKAMIKNKLRKLTSEWLRLTSTLVTPLSVAFALASPCNITSGAPLSPGRISISFIGAAEPLLETPSDLKTASLPTQRAAKDAAGEG
jgi:hypothetical protein